MKNIISVVGARPNFMKVAPIHRAFKKYEDMVNHIIVHTGQHYDVKMSDAFFNDLQMPAPDYFLGVGSGSHAEQTAKIMIEFEKICLDVKPELVIVVGDVNSTLACSITAAKLGIKLAHIESGLRSGDRGMPEEINRIVTDSITDFCFVTEQSGFTNLIKSGFDQNKIFFAGNTMIDSLRYAESKAKESLISEKMGLDDKDFILVTMHRPSNVDGKNSLEELLNVFIELSKEKKIVFPIHPRTLKNIEKFGLYSLIKDNDRIILCEPLGYIEFLSLMMKSALVLTDSGGIQEETTALGIPCITARTTTERPVTCEIGTNILADPQPALIKEAVLKALSKPKISWKLPPLWDGNAGERIVETLIDLVYNV